MHKKADFKQSTWEIFVKLPDTGHNSPICPLDTHGGRAPLVAAKSYGRREWGMNTAKKGRRTLYLLLGEQ